LSEDKSQSFFTRMRAKINRPGSWLSYDLAQLVPGRKIDAEVLDELETRLLTADVGVDATQYILEDLRKKVARKELDDVDALVAALTDAITEILLPSQQPLDISQQKPFVLLVVGVNGSGKTTTIGKLARRFADANQQVVLAAAIRFARRPSSSSVCGPHARAPRSSNSRREPIPARWSSMPSRRPARDAPMSSSSTPRGACTVSRI